MYQVNPLVDVHANITPAEIMYRLDNIHSALHSTKSIIGQSTLTPSTKKKLESSMAANGPKKEQKVESPNKTEKVHKEKQPQTSKASNLTPQNLLKELDEKITRLKLIKNQLDNVDSTLIDNLAAPFGRSTRLNNVFNSKAWLSDRNQLKAVTGIKKTCNGKLRLVISVPARSFSCSWLPLTIELLRSRHGKCLVTQHIHSSVSNKSFHDRPLLALSDAANENEADIFIRVLIKDDCTAPIPELIIDGWPNRHHVFVGYSVATTLGLLAGAHPPNADVVRPIGELTQRIVDAQCAGELQAIVNEATKLLSKPSANGKKAEYFAGDAATIIDVMFIATLVNSPFYSSAKKSLALDGLVNKIIVK